MSGSKDFDFNFDRTAELSVVGLELDMDPSDLALTNLSFGPELAVLVVLGLDDACRL